MNPTISVHPRTGDGDTFTAVTTDVHCWLAVRSEDGELNVHISTLADAQALAAAAVAVLDHMRDLSGKPITKTDDPCPTCHGAIVDIAADGECGGGPHTCGGCFGCLGPCPTCGTSGIAPKEAA